MESPSPEVMALVSQGYSYEHALHYTDNPDISRRNEKVYRAFVRRNNRVLQNLRRDSNRAQRAMVSRSKRGAHQPIDYSEGSNT